MKKIFRCILLLALTLMLSSCAYLEFWLKEIKGDLIGNSFVIETYDNYGDLTMTTVGEKINIKGNRVKELVITNEGYGHSYELSSAVTINIDGKEMLSCGDTLIFAEKGLTKIMDFTSPEFINSVSSGELVENTMFAYSINQYKNLFGKEVIVIIKSQMGQPLCAYSGDVVHWEIPDDLPKTTKLLIDGKALYIHRANYQIIEKALLND